MAKKQSLSSLKAEICNDAINEQVDRALGETEFYDLEPEDLTEQEKNALLSVFAIETKGNADVGKALKKRYPAVFDSFAKKMSSNEEKRNIDMLTWLAKKPWWNDRGVKTFLTPEGASYAKEEDSARDREKAREIAREHPELVAKIKKEHPKLAARIMKEIQ